MSQKTVTLYTDDLDDREIKPGKGGEVRFSVDSAQYVIDLSDSNKKKLLAALAPFVDKARKDRARGRTKKSTTAGISPAEVREWARQNGFEVPDRGRIPDHVRDAYDARK